MSLLFNEPAIGLFTFLSFGWGAKPGSCCLTFIFLHSSTEPQWLPIGFFLSFIIFIIKHKNIFSRHGLFHFTLCLSKCYTFIKHTSLLHRVRQSGFIYIFQPGWVANRGSFIFLHSTTKLQWIPSGFFTQYMHSANLKFKWNVNLKHFAERKKISAQQQTKFFY